jgi:hypothetical protein
MDRGLLALAGPDLARRTSSVPHPEARSVQVALPVSRHTAGRSGHRLCQRVVLRRSKDRAVGVLLRGVVPEPVLVRLEASDDGMPSFGRVSAGVLGRRRIAAADVPAVSAAPQVEPPAGSGCARRIRHSARLTFLAHRGPLPATSACIRPAETGQPGVGLRLGSLRAAVVAGGASAGARLGSRPHAEPPRRSRRPP